MTCWLNACRSASCVDVSAELRAGPAQPLGEVAAQRRHRHEPEHVQADREDRDPRAPAALSGAGTSGSGTSWYCAITSAP